MASSTRARVFRLTCELEFSTREMVPMPTPAARATSRIVVFAGTVSIQVTLFADFGSCLIRQAKDLPTICTRASLAHRSGRELEQCSLVALRSLLARFEKTSADEVIFIDSVLTDTSCSVRVWNQFQHFAPRVAAGEWGVR